MKDEHSSAGVSSACQFVMVLGRNLAMDKDVRVIIVWNKGAQVNATVSHSVPLEAFAAPKGSAVSINTLSVPKKSPSRLYLSANLESLIMKPTLMISIHISISHTWCRLGIVTCAGLILMCLYWS
jgi:hypothetical protein